MSRAGEQCVVLIVEDDVDSYELYSEVLAGAGFAVVGADSGDDALARAVERKPDLVVMDYELRGMDGAVATELLKRDPRTRHIPILMLTGHVAPRHLERARASGCDAVLSKPCPIDRLLEQVNLLTNHAAGHRWGKTILLVEDDDEHRASLGQLLAEEGFHVVDAANGQRALECLRRSFELPALILLDLMMPVMDGWRFRAEQLADPRLAHIPVVVVSATNEVPKQARALHVEEFLPKPIDLPQLMTIVQRHV